MNIFRLILAFLVIFGVNEIPAADKESDPLWHKAKEWLYMPDDQSKAETKTDEPKARKDVKKVKLSEPTVGKGEEKPKEEEKNFFEKFFDEVIQSDPLGVSKFKKTINERDVFDPLNPRLVKFDGFSRSIGNRISFARDLGRQRSAGIHFGYYPLKLKDNFDHMKMDSMDLSVSFRRYIHDKYFYQANAGVRRYQPNEGYRAFYSARNQAFDPKDLPFLYVAVGRRLVKKLPVIKRPLVLTASYSFSDDLEYPSADPYGYTKIDLSGFDLGLSIRFKI